jgi:hypothetical protein
MNPLNSVEALHETMPLQDVWFKREFDKNVNFRLSTKESWFEVPSNSRGLK